MADGKDEPDKVAAGHNNPGTHAGDYKKDSGQEAFEQMQAGKGADYKPMDELAKKAGTAKVDAGYAEATDEDSGKESKGGKQ